MTICVHITLNRLVERRYIEWRRHFQIHLHLNYSVINPTSVERVGNETDTESFKIYIDYYAKKKN